MFGKHHASMYTGSMCGAGFGPYAVMGYVIANQRPEKIVRGLVDPGARGKFHVNLQPIVMAAIFGEKVELVEEAIMFLCAPDAQSTTPTEEGRRLVKVGQFTYWVVNGAMYDAIRNEETRLEQNRLAQARYREKHPERARRRKRDQVSAEYLEREGRGVKAAEAGDQVKADEIAAEGCPVMAQPAINK